VELRTRSGVRVLGPADLDAVRRLLDRDPVTHVFVDHRVRVTRMEPRWLGGEIWGYQDGDELVSICHAAANLTPVFGTPEALDAFAARALAQGRSCGSIMGPEDEVRHLWRILGEQWGPARSIRPVQPFMILDHQPEVEPTPAVRRVRPDELDVLYPACVAMYTEELGVSPEANGGARLYRARVAQLISKGHAFAHVENGEVIFKAELFAVTPHAAHLQSVWVDPRRRGQGLAAGGVAAVCEQTLRDVAPVVSLYVNEHNEPALRTYDRVGFRRTGTFATILF
jgi:predicted GNAT family acetyltransferase